MVNLPPSPGSLQSKNNSAAADMRLPEVGEERTWTKPVHGRLLQRSVQACERSWWSLLTWPAEGGAEEHERRASPFVCGSWRCRRCGPFVASQDYRRVEEAALSRRWWLYVVLTFDPAQWANPWDAYTEAGKLWNNRLHKRLQREHGRVEYVQTWERHVRGSSFPHVNLLLTGDGLREAVELDGVESRYDERAGHGAGRWTRFPFWRTRWLAKAAPDAGFGLRVWAEVVDQREGMAHYLVKAAHDLSAARWKAGNQSPIGAPPHFRRYRASRGLLPARPESEGVWSGAIARQPPSAFVDRSTGEMVVSNAAVIQALDAREKAAAWAILNAKPAPRYEA